MKRTNPSYLYFFVLVLFSQPSFAQTQAAPKEELKGAQITAQQAGQQALDKSKQDLSQRKIENITLQQPAQPADQAAQQPTQQPATQAAAQPVAKAVGYYTASGTADAKEVDSIVGAAELEKVGLSLGFGGTQAQLIGSLPGACADNLVMDVVKHAPDSDDDDAEFSSVSDLNKKTSEVGVRVIFHGNEKAKTLSDCLAVEKDTDKNNLAGYGPLNKSILDGNEYARLGSMDAAGKITLDDKAPVSDSYKKVSKVLEYKDCPDCKVSLKKIQKAMGELDDQPAVASPLRIALIDKGLSDIKDQLDRADTIRKLKSVRDDLVSYAKWIGSLKSDSDDRDALLSKVTDAFKLLQKRTGIQAYADGANAGKYADLIAETGGIIAKTTALDKDFRGEQKDVQKAYAKGGSMRLNFVSGVDPDNGEVRDYLNNGANLIHNAQQNANKQCSGMNGLGAVFRSQAKQLSKADACNQAIADLKATQAQVETLAKNFMVAQQLPSELQPNATNSFAGNGTPPAGGYFPGQTGPNGQPTAVNSVFGQNPSVMQNASAYAPNPQNLYQVTAPNYQNNAGSQFQIANPTVAVPLNQMLMPQPQNGASLTPQYQYRS